MRSQYLCSFGKRYFINHIRHRFLLLVCLFQLIGIVFGTRSVKTSETQVEQPIDNGPLGEDGESQGGAKVSDDEQSRRKNPQGEAVNQQKGGGLPGAPADQQKGGSLQDTSASKQKEGVGLPGTPADQQKGGSLQDTSASKQKEGGGLQDTSGTKPKEGGSLQDTSGSKQKEGGGLQDTSGNQQTEGGGQSGTSGSQKRGGGGLPGTAGSQQGVPGSQGVNSASGSGSQASNPAAGSTSTTTAPKPVEITAEAVKNETECVKACKTFGKFPTDIEDEEKKAALLTEFRAHLAKNNITSPDESALLVACNSAETAPCIAESGNTLGIALGVTGGILAVLVIGGGGYYA